MLVLYIAANLAIAIAVGCMLFSAFVTSSHRFRVAVGMFAAASLGCAFLGAELLGDFARHVDFGQIAFVAFSQLAQSIALAVVVVAMRLRQRAEKRHLHPRQCAADAEDLVRQG
jgi:hypothetical protein